MIEAKANKVRETLLDVAPWLDAPEYAPAVARFLRAEARALLAHDHIIRVSEEQGFEKVSTRLVEAAAATDRLAAQLGNVLGLDPLGRTRLQHLAAGTQLTVETLGQLAAKGRAIVEDRLAEIEEEPSDEVTDGVEA
jgi:hypothetical protein